MFLKQIRLNLSTQQTLWSESAVVLCQAVTRSKKNHSDQINLLFSVTAEDNTTVALEPMKVFH